MRNGKILPLLVKLSVPAMIGMIVNAIYNIVDRMFIGNAPQLGSTGLAAVSVSYPITLLIMAVGLGAGVGGSTRFSIALGQRDEEAAKYYQGNALMMGVCFGIFIMVFGELFATPLLTLLGASEIVLPYARKYLSIVLLGAVFQCVSLCGNNFSRAQGNAKNAMVSQLLGACFNIIFDYVFIYIVGLGMEGAALATIGGQCLSMFWQLAFLFGKRNLIQCRFSHMKLRKNYAIAIAKTGIPAFLLQIANSVLSSVLNIFCGIYGGDVAISTTGVLTSIQTLMLLPLTGMSQGQQPLISYNYGAKLYDRLRQILKYTTVGATIIALCLWAVVQLFPTVIISMFNQEPEIIELGTYALRTWFMCYPVVGAQMMCANFFQAIGKIQKSSFLNLLRQIVLLIPLIMIMSYIFGLNGIFMACPIADVSALLITLFFFKKEMNGLVE